MKTSFSFVFAAIAALSFFLTSCAPKDEVIPTSSKGIEALNEMASNVLGQSLRYKRTVIVDSRFFQKESDFLNDQSIEEIRAQKYQVLPYKKEAAGKYTKVSEDFIQRNPVLKGAIGTLTNAVDPKLNGQKESLFWVISDQRVQGVATGTGLIFSPLKHIGLYRSGTDQVNDIGWTLVAYYEFE